MAQKALKYVVLIPLIILSVISFKLLYKAPETKILLNQTTNGDETRYIDKRGSFGKGLKKTKEGLVDPEAFAQVVRTVNTRSIEEFNKIPWGVQPPLIIYNTLRWAIAENVMGKEVWLQVTPPPPTVASSEKASEVVELYWHALLRDIPFTQYATNERVAVATEDLSRCSDFKGPKVNDKVTAQTLFRTTFDGVLEGPYVSQFFYYDIPLEDEAKLSQRYTTQQATLSNEFMTSLEEWRFIELGNQPVRKITYDPKKRYICTMRDLGNYVHMDPPQWHFLCTQLILLGFGQEALKQGAPALTPSLQPAQTEFCKLHLGGLVSLCTEMTSRAAWYQKWFIHRSLRAEEYAYLVDQQIKNIFDAGLHEDVINSQAAQEIFALNSQLNNGEGTYLLPQMYPEGCPLHPSYPSAHGSVAGGCITILKAFFNEDFVFAKPVIPNADGSALEAYKGEPLTIGHELNKFAMNIAFARNMAGVHYRCDAVEAMLMGEKIALALLADWAKTNNMHFTLKKFDGTSVSIG
ncbi:MAG: vanadium-dependent haloperoxidase [Candidatus Babeliales bacterium]